MQKLLGEGLPHLCIEGTAAGLRVPVHNAIIHNVGQWPLQTPCFVRLHERQAGVWAWLEVQSPERSKAVVLLQTCLVILDKSPPFSRP